MPGPRKILLIDDDVDHLSICKLVLTNRGYTVLVLWNTDVLIEVVKDFAPDLIFMDHNMPEMNGIKATRLLKSHSATDKIPIVYFTGQDNGADLARQAGADGYLPKPFKIEQLLEKIDQFSQGRE